MATYMSSDLLIISMKQDIVELFLPFWGRFIGTHLVVSGFIPGLHSKITPGYA